MSARHANRSRRPQQPDRERGSGRPRGGFGDSERGPLSYGPVPSTRQVNVGSPVSIVLKVDQPTGHQVQGIVAELLTRGDHPRGIKVRLQDGRVGRVQKMISMGVSTVTAETIAFSRSRYSDFRADATEEPEREASLADYVVKDKRKSKGLKGGSTATTGPDNGHNGTIQNADDSSTISPTVTCPVCGDFQGDEAAVAHHVDGHFA
ncbi:uncharacterized protein LY89DRAFT_593846 [Mollisia scopiformis]|uniref:Uncharacterized protein n=1 Tax=Mollisia scopiformis TaxID=149040 RepID=A0A194WW79_MOLSC|nr:uncharacterized protein LY89DRAFT_593846 [Mollisia scopiformis]KUJ12225.1 hypothetical protein LY89DRAFT_593846 [Mollisia scopiformis]